MAWEGALHFLPGLKAAADYSGATAQFRFGTIDSSGNFVLATAAGQRGIVGVLQDTPASADPALVADSGVSKVRCGAAVTAGNKIITDATGQGIPASAVSTNHIQGYALETVATAGELFACVLKYDGNNAP
jgi:hypothetical protein